MLNFTVTCILFKLIYWDFYFILKISSFYLICLFLFPNCLFLFYNVSFISWFSSRNTLILCLKTLNQIHLFFLFYGYEISCLLGQIILYHNCWASSCVLKFLLEIFSSFWEFLPNLGSFSLLPWGSFAFGSGFYKMHSSKSGFMIEIQFEFPLWG